MMDHPEVPSCGECQQWVYDPETWSRQKKGGVDIRRKPGMKLPCRVCPKKSPEESKRHYELNDRNLRALTFYREVAAMGFDWTDEERSDGVLRRNMAIIHQHIQIYDAYRSHRSSVVDLATMLIGKV